MDKPPQPKPDCVQSLNFCQLPNYHLLFVFDLVNFEWIIEERNMRATKAESGFPLFILK